MTPRMAPRLVPEAAQALVDAAGRVGRAQLAAAGVPLTSGEAEQRLTDRVRSAEALWCAGRVRAQVSQELDPGGAAAFDSCPDTAAALGVLASPAPLLALLGGDARTLPTGGRNRYGLPAYDLAPVSRLSSCTSSPPDAAALTAIEGWRLDALDRVRLGGLARATAHLRDTSAADVLRALDLPADDESGLRERVLLTPSGTDGESLVAALLLASRDVPVLNILVGAAEAGGASLLAAAGRWFGTRAPLAVGLEHGAPIDGVDSDRLDVVDVQVRDAAGRPRLAFDVEAEVEAHLEDAVAAGALVLVHVMDGSKTGIRHLGADWCARWMSRCRGSLEVLVDASQHRSDAQSLQAYLDAGASIMVTGSKASCAPSFCGAVVLADSVLRACEGLPAGSLPAGLQAAVARADLPAALAHLLPATAEVLNPALMARWHVAAVERERLRAAGAAAESAREVLVEECARALARHPALVPVHGGEPTIACFAVTHAGGALGAAAMREVYDDVVSGEGVWIGQPVELAPGGVTVLRLAIGAATVTRLLEQPGGLRRAAAGVVQPAVERVAAAAARVQPKTVVALSELGRRTGPVATGTHRTAG